MKPARKKQAKETGFKRDAVAKPTALVAPGTLRWLVPAFIVLATGLAFLPSLQNGLVNWDDDSILLKNPHYRGLGWEPVGWMFTTFYFGHYQPLTWLTFAVDYLIWGMNPFGYHLTNLLLHAANAVIFYFIAIRLLTLAGSGAARDLAVRGAAAFAALIFAIHPLRVESVAWATERRDVLSGLFFLGTILCYLRYAAPSNTRGMRRGWLIAALIVYGLSLLSKATGITLPLVLLILDIYPLKRLDLSPKRWFEAARRQVWLEKLPFFLLALVFGIVALRAQHEAGALVAVERYSFALRLAQAVLGLNFYLWRTLFPFGLSPLYQRPIDFDPFSAPVLIGAMVVVLITAGLFMLRRRCPAGLALWAYYAIVLLPVLGIAQSGPQFVADRYSYLSCLGWAVLAGAGLLYVWHLWSSRRIGRATFAVVGGCAAAVVVLFGVLTWGQVKMWKDSETLWRYTLDFDQESNIAHYNLGLALAVREQWDEAIEHFREAIRIKPDYALAHHNLGIALAERGQVEEAIEQYQEALRLDANRANSHYSLALALARRGQQDQAIEQYREALRLDPNHANAHYNLALALAERAQTKEATEHYREVLRINPADAQAHNKLAVALAREGKLEESIQHLRKTLELEIPAGTRIETHFYLGIALAKRGDLDQARDHFAQALKLKPDFAEAQHYLGRVLAAQGDLNKAIEYFRQAIRSNPRFAEAHQSLSEALAEQGKKDEAIEHSQIALQLLKSRRKVADRGME